jgi:hypothetical protein
MPVERRAFPRTRIDCRMAVFSDLRILAFNSDIINIGGGGVRLMLREKLPIATPIQLELSLSHEPMPIQCRGEITWFKERNPDESSLHILDTGIKFTDIIENDKEIIRNEVKSFLSEKRISQ